MAGESSWNDRSSPTDWIGGGSALGGATSIGTMAYSPAHPQYTEYWKSVPAALIEQWITGVNSGLVMKMADATISNGTFYSSEHTPHPTLGTLRPILQIRYAEVPEPMTVVLLGLGGLLIRRKR